MSEHLQKYLEYIDNTGGVTVAQFDEDWEPIGPMVRQDLAQAGLAQNDCGQMVRVSPKELNAEQKEILQHTLRTGQPFCGGSADMDGLVTAGLMECLGEKSFVPEPYYGITVLGRAAASD